MSPAEVSWPEAKPAQEGMSKAGLDRLGRLLAEHGTRDFVVARRGRLLYEWYGEGRGPQTRHFTASLAKSLVGGMALLLALSDGRLDPDQRAADFIPAWRDDPQKSQITIRQLASHSSGLEDAETPGKGHFDQGGWKERFWRQEPDPFSIAIHEAPIIFPPGSDFAYSNPGFAALGYAITASLKGSEHPDLLSLLRARLMEPLGIPPEAWSMGYSKLFSLDGLQLYATWGGGEYTPRAVAKVGQLMLQRGQWAGQTLLDPDWVRKATAAAAGPLPTETKKMPASGLCWWNNAVGTWPALPRDAFLGAGAGNQILLVIPSKELVVVRNGDNLGESKWGEGFWVGLEKYLLNPLMDCFLAQRPRDRQRAPYPPSPVIQRARFAPVTSIQRAAFDSDNWPATWGADNAVYTAYGDGQGFIPYTEEKIGLGLARVTGQPPDFHGENVRAPGLENKLFGANGAKASGLLMVNERLYLLARNCANAQLAWSDDQGHSWAWNDWKFSESFGHPTFLNFGRNYQGARDEFVYIYSHDGDSAYRPADRMVLARAPKDGLTERGAYRFFVGLDEEGNPLWSADIEQRGAVFEHPKRCLRSGITYNAVLGRYLWWQQIPANGKEDTRFAGGFGLYDAPEPWGPWTTVYFTTEWDTGPGELGSLPTAWMSADGRTCYLLFSGYDYFSVRKVTFQV